MSQVQASEAERIAVAMAARVAATMAVSRFNV
jgi:hypothetical protein